LARFSQSRSAVEKNWKSGLDAFRRVRYGIAEWYR
jgi:hypothetical protein